MISLISSFSLKLYLDSLVYHRNMFVSSSKVFGNLQKKSLDIFGNSRKMFGNACLAFGTILENLRKSSDSGRKPSENYQKRCHQYVYVIKRILHVSSKICILCSRGRRTISQSERSERVRYCSRHLNIHCTCAIHIFLLPCNILCVLHSTF